MITDNSVCVCTYMDRSFDDLSDGRWTDDSLED